LNPHTSFRWLVVLPVICLFAGVPARSAQENPVESPNDLSITVGKSAVVSSPQTIVRVAVGFGDVAEAVAVGPNEVLVSGKAPGSTSLIVWQQGGGKLFFDVKVRPNLFLANNRVDNLRREISKELPGQQITASLENDAVFLRGKVKDLTSAGRAVAMASTLGKVVNLLYVDVPAAESQILLKVRFASLDRSLDKQLALNLFSTGATNTIGSTSTQQYPAPTLPQTSQPNNATKPFVFSDLLNVFLFRPDLNLGATIKALESKGLIQILAEPNVLAQNGTQASFLAGGEFPYPVLQSTGGGSIPAVTIQFREFGVRLNFIPTITPRGTIRLQVAPEVSSLDFSNGLTIAGYNIPSLISRKVKTEVELAQGQSFAIAGLLDKRVTDTFEKMPVIGDLPILGKFFQSKNTSRTNTELVVIVTPELVRPMPAGTPAMNLPYPKPFLESSPESAVRTPGIASTGPVPVTPPVQSIPVEKLIHSMKPEKPLTGNTGNGNSPDNAPQREDTSAPEVMTSPQNSHP
jgi:pilus assembly protein CpaC